MKRFFLFSFLLASLQTYSQSIYFDVMLLDKLARLKGCVGNNDLERLKTNYAISYINIHAVGVEWCEKDKMREDALELIEQLSPLQYTGYSSEEEGQAAAETEVFSQAAEKLEKFKERYRFLTKEERVYILGEETNAALDKWDEQMANFMDRYGGNLIVSRGAGFLGPLIGLGQSANVGGSSSGGGSLFSASPAVFVNAASNFIVAKTKYELNAKFVDELRKVYEERVEFKELMPAANAIIMSADPLNFATWNSMLQGALKKDMANMPYNLPNFINSEHSFFKDVDPQSLETITIPLMALQAFENNRRGMLPVSNFLRLEESFGVKNRPGFQLAKGMTLTRTLVESFSYEDQLVSANAIYQIANDRDKKELFYFLYMNKYNELLNEVKTSDSSSVGENLSGDWEKSTDELLTLAARLNAGLIQANNSFQRLQEGKVEKQAMPMELVSINAVIPEFIDAAFTYLFIVEPNNEKTKGRYNRVYKPLTIDAVNLANGVLLENYNATLLATVNIMVTSLREVNHRAPQTDNEIDRAVRNRERIDKMIHWGGFLADFLTLDNQSDATDLFVKYSTVNASYRVKRSNKYSLSLNAYPGFYFGNEQLSFSDNFKQFNASTALSVPVGINFSQAFTRRASTDDFDYYRERQDRMKLFRYTGFVHGVFIPLFDMGAPFAYRWANDASAGFTDELKWAQLFSPGAYYTFGLRGSGITLAVGGQMTPELRSVDQNQLVAQESAWRLGMLLTYDIPVLTLWKSRL
jgi:hypothetical protein